MIDYSLFSKSTIRNSLLILKPEPAPVATTRKMRFHVDMLLALFTISVNLQIPISQMHLQLPLCKIHTKATSILSY